MSGTGYALLLNIGLVAVFRSLCVVDRYTEIWSRRLVSWDLQTRKPSEKEANHELWLPVKEPGKAPVVVETFRLSLVMRHWTS